MRILQATSTGSLGGGAVHLSELIAALARRGHEVHLAARPGTPIVERARPHVAAVHALDPGSAFDPLAALRLRRILREGGMDVLHCHSGTLYRIAHWARRLGGRTRLVFTPHHFRLRRHTWLYRRMMRRVDAIVAVSGSMRERIVAQYGVDPARIATIPNWVDAGRYADLPARDDARRTLGVTREHALGLIGSVLPLKGQEEFVRAAAIVAARRGDVEFLVVGLNRHAKGRFVEKLERLRSELGLGDRLRLLPWQEDVRPVLAALTVLAAPSWNEAFSLVLVEAMAAGVPVVASDVGGPGEIVTDGETGLHVPPRDPEALAAAMGRLLDDPTLRERLRTRAREEVARRYALEPAVDRLVALYSA